MGRVWLPLEAAGVRFSMNEEPQIIGKPLELAVWFSSFHITCCDLSRIDFKEPERRQGRDCGFVTSS